MKWLLALAAWLALSAGFLFLGFTLVANAFGREGNGNHLAGFALVLVLWLAGSALGARLALRGWRGRRPW